MVVSLGVGGVSGVGSGDGNQDGEDEELIIKIELSQIRLRAYVDCIRRGYSLSW